MNLFIISAINKSPYKNKSNLANFAVSYRYAD